MKPSLSHQRCVFWATKFFEILCYAFASELPHSLYEKQASLLLKLCWEMKPSLPSLGKFFEILATHSCQGGLILWFSVQYEARMKSLTAAVSGLRPLQALIQDSEHVGRGGSDSDSNNSVCSWPRVIRTGGSRFTRIEISLYPKFSENHILIPAVWLCPHNSKFACPD